MNEDAFAQHVGRSHLVPLWNVMRGMLPAQPRPAAQVHHWPRKAWHEPLEASAVLVTAEEAERRVLLLENPAFVGESRAAGTLHAGLQLLMPGETAPPHRHSQAALRFVIEGSGASTAVNGERQDMLPGDFILTPAFTWHEHANPGGEPMVWLDGLDLPLVRLLGSTFAQFPGAPDPFADTGTCTALPGMAQALLPPRQTEHARLCSKMRYPYKDARAALDWLRAAGKVDAAYGLRLHYADPASGGHAMPTMAAYLQLLPAGFKGRPYQSTESFVFYAVEGAGRTVTRDADGAKRTLDWARGDLFVLPGWVEHSHSSTEDAVLFSFSDAAAQQALGLWRERRH
ncbi:MAG: cupin domain-containing protein [Burkholderiales bacterium]